MAGEFVGASHNSDPSENLKWIGPSSKILANGMARVVAVLVAIALLGIVFDIVANLPKITPSPWNISGIAWLAAGAYLEAHGVYVLWTIGQGTPHPANPPRRLVIEGPYRYSRNPLYLGRLLVLLGVSVYLGSMGILALAAVLFLFVHFVVLPREEGRLQARYGEAWLHYSNRISRWVTLPRRTHRSGGVPSRRGRN